LSRSLWAHGFTALPGSVVAFVGLTAAPFTTLIMLGLVYDSYGDLPAVRHAFAGLAAAASAMVLATALRIAAPLRTRPFSIRVAVVIFLAIAVLRPPVLPAMAAVSTLLVWRFGE
jgi:chromate transporter